MCVQGVQASLHHRCTVVQQLVVIATGDSSLILANPSSALIEKQVGTID